MHGKNKKMYKSILKERNKPTPTPVKQSKPPLVKQSNPAPASSLFTKLTETMGQGMAFGAGSSIGHRAIDIVSGLWGGKEELIKQEITNTTIINECDDYKKEFVACIQNSDHCNEVQSQYLNCLDKFKSYEKE